MTPNRAAALASVLSREELVFLSQLTRAAKINADDMCARMTQLFGVTIPEEVESQQKATAMYELIGEAIRAALAIKENGGLG